MTSSPEVFLTPLAHQPFLTDRSQPPHPEVGMKLAAACHWAREGVAQLCHPEVVPHEEEPFLHPQLRSWQWRSGWSRRRELGVWGAAPHGWGCCDWVSTCPSALSLHLRTCSQIRRFPRLAPTRPVLGRAFVSGSEEGGSQEGGAWGLRPRHSTWGAQRKVWGEGSPLGHVVYKPNIVSVCVSLR